MEPYILMGPSVATPLIQLYGRVGRRSLQYSRDSRAVSEGHLSAVDPLPRVLRVPKPKLLMYPWMYFPGEGANGFLGAYSLVYCINFNPSILYLTVAVPKSLAEVTRGIRGLV